MSLTVPLSVAQFWRLNDLAIKHHTDLEQKRTATAPEEKRTGFLVIFWWQKLKVDQSGRKEGKERARGGRGHHIG